MDAQTSTLGGRNPSSPSSPASISTRINQVFRQLTLLGENLLTRYGSLTKKQKILVLLLLSTYTLITLGFLIVGPQEIFHKTAQLALWISSQPLGVPLILALITVLSFPPTVGYGTAITLCGLGWANEKLIDPNDGHVTQRTNLLRAWILASTGCILGSSCSFLFFRYWIVRRGEGGGWVGRMLKDETFVAMGKAVKSRGTKMVILIRFCPFPFAYSNLFFASLHSSVSYRQFLLSTALITPKLFLHVFIGQRMYQLMDRDQRAKMDFWSKLVNAIYIAIGSLVGFLTSWVVWRETRKILDETRDQEPEGGNEDEQEEETEGNLDEDDRDQEILLPTPSNKSDPQRNRLEDLESGKRLLSDYD
ncbi:hypothetical protein IE53DRAFT_389823 [Violaceomyces palustris]|uniref:Uncharacterized protein n=1 Tax=Violaceomyces palustris TaxID=1673888 RepID=A0ACD0NQ92_9BASI|nr:hypothetical protein IE53DRAFT_389823 [Violaceomyces palustris]